MTLRRLSPLLFDWQAWRSGSPASFFVPCREPALVANGDMLRAHAVGYCPGDRLPCRPKAGTKAVMFFKDDDHFWFHLTDREFGLIFDGGGK